MRGVGVLAWRELLRFWRQPSRLVGSLAQPLMVWFLLKAGFAGSFRAGQSGTGYGEFFYPGVVLMLILFAAIFSTITIIEDRTAGFLQGVVVAPISGLAIVIGKLVGGTTIALLQAGIFLGLAPLAGLSIGWQHVIGLVFVFGLIGLGFTGLGFIAAWLSDTVAGYHAVMSLVLFPMWLLSGALFPLEGSSSWLGWIMRCNPATYAMFVVRQGFYRPLWDLVDDSSFLLALLVSVLWTGTTIAGSALVVVLRKGA